MKESQDNEISIGNTSEKLLNDETEEKDKKLNNKK